MIGPLRRRRGALVLFLAVATAAGLVAAVAAVSGGFAAASAAAAAPPGAAAPASPSPAARSAPAAPSSPSPASSPSSHGVEHQTYGRFGEVSIYRRTPIPPQGVVVLLSDDDGWSARAEELARGLESLDALVIGLDLSYYLGRVEKLTQDCAYPAGDFEMLSKLVQKALGLPTYTPPVLAGYGAGATLAYGALAQAPSGSFAGAISLGFCPELEASHPLCAGRGLVSKRLPAGGSYQLQPVASLDQPWLLTPPLAPGGSPGKAAARCGGAAAEAFAARIHGAAVISPPQSSGRHRASPELRAVSGLKQAYVRARNAADLGRPPETAVRKSLADLPLLELPVPGSTGDTLAVIVSGDGGWAGLDRDVASQLADHGFPVVGLNSLSFFWRPRTPEGAAADLARILRTYLAAWKRKDAVLVGYSLGAEVLPFMANRLPPDLLSKVRLVALLGPGRSTSFEFRLSEWLGHGGGENRPVLPELARLRGTKVVCVYGKGEKATSLCSAAGSSAVAVELPGAHYLGSDPGAVVAVILRQAARGAAVAGGSEAAPAAAGRAPAGNPAAASSTGAPPAPGALPPGSTPPASPPPSPPPAKAPPASPPPSPPPESQPPATLRPASPLLAVLASAAGDVASLAFGRLGAWSGGLGRSSVAAAQAPLAPALFAVHAGLAAPAAAIARAAPAAPPAEETMDYGRFGTLHLLRESAHPANIVMLFSGEGGWDATAAQIAHTFAARGFLAVGIDTRRYLERVAAHHDGCAYTAGSLENLSKVLQKRLGFPAYLHPLVAGVGGGGALAYGALAQAPAKTFRGGLGVAFCADLPGALPLCAGHGLATRPATRSGFQLLPAQGLEQPWVALQGAADRRCSAATAAEFTRGTPGGDLITVAGGRALSPPKLWQTGLGQAIDRVLAPAPAPSATSATSARNSAGAPAGPVEVVGSKALPGLPLIEMASAGAPGGPLAVILSGDGGWASVDREVAKVLAGQRGVPVIGFDTLAYFWNSKTPEAAAADLQRLLRHYLTALNRGQVLLIGYSLGADVLPFLANRLPPDLLDRVRLIALLGPSHTTPFEIRVKEDKASELPVKPEVEKLRGRPLLCVAAEGESDSLCSDLDAELAQTVELKGSHAFNGDYEQLADRILKGVQPAGARPGGGKGGQR